MGQATFSLFSTYKGQLSSWLLNYQFPIVLPFPATLDQFYSGSYLHLEENLPDVTFLMPMRQIVWLIYQPTADTVLHTEQVLMNPV